MVDAAGNATTSTVSFEVGVTASDLDDEVTRFRATGDIGTDRLARFLVRKLQGGGCGAPA